MCYIHTYIHIIILLLENQGEEFFATSIRQHILLDFGPNPDSSDLVLIPQGMADPCFTISVSLHLRQRFLCDTALR